jgi:ADP-ribosyl-[dinitrogen reductase] hydrolase
MSVSNTGGHGRGSQEGKIVGDVILKGKHHRWGIPNVHYHEGLSAGENTLNAQCMRLVMRCITHHNGIYDQGAFLNDYITYMTKSEYNDTYAESFHRDFFSNWARGVPPEECSKGTEGHNTASIGGLVMLTPIICAAILQETSNNNSSSSDEEVVEEAVKHATKDAVGHLSLTHESRRLTDCATSFTELLTSIILSAPSSSSEVLKKRGAATAEQLFNAVNLPSTLRHCGNDDTAAIQSIFGSACYIDMSYPSVLYLAYKYSGDFEAAVVANANAGGDNCHRGSAVGALVGAAVGYNGLPDKYKDGLFEEKEIKKEIDAFIGRFID